MLLEMSLSGTVYSVGSRELYRRYNEQLRVYQCVSLTRDGRG